MSPLAFRAVNHELTAQSMGPDPKAALDRARSIENKNARLAGLTDIVRFTYSPTGDNRSRDALNHSEVIAMTSHFIGSRLIDSQSQKITAAASAMADRKTFGQRS